MKKVNTHCIPIKNLSTIVQHINDKLEMSDIYYVCGAEILVPFIDSVWYNKYGYDVINIGKISSGRTMQDVADIVFDNIMRNDNIKIGDTGFRYGEHLYGWA
jgi:hypothetical protein